MPVLTSNLQQSVGTDDIGFDEFSRSVDRAIHVGLGGQVHYRIRLLLAKHPFDLGTVTNIHLFKGVTLTDIDFS
ncbi:hypothetical protein D3C84_1036850 [compost metagenome]